MRNIVLARRNSVYKMDIAIIMVGYKFWDDSLQHEVHLYHVS